MSTIPLSRGRGLLAVAFLSIFAGTACTASLARYPKAGEPGPVVTAAGDTIPYGPARDTFMAGYRAGFERSGEVEGAYALRVLAGAGGGLLVGSNFLPLLAGRIPAAPGMVAGVGLVTAAVSYGPIPPLTPPTSVAEQGPLYVAGYREGYTRGIQEKRRFAAIGGALLGTGAGVALLFALLPAT